MFQHLECSVEIKRNEEDHLEKILLNRNIDVIKRQLQPQFRQLLNDTLNRFFNSTDQLKQQNVQVCRKWSFYNSFFFCFTIVSTIGYGHQFPVTNEGRWACIMYALIGIPLNGILIASIGSMYHSCFKMVSERWKNKDKTSLSNRQMVIAFVVKSFVFLSFFTSIFLFIPAKLLQQMESRKSWDYTSSFYFTFVTLSTIGFGDMVAGDSDESENAEWSFERICYHIFIILWMVFGMGYIWGVVEVLTLTLKKSSRPVINIWKRMIEELNSAEPNVSVKVDAFPNFKEDRKSLSLGDLEGNLALERDSLTSLKDISDIMPKVMASRRGSGGFPQKSSSQTTEMCQVLLRI